MELILGGLTQVIVADSKALVYLLLIWSEVSLLSKLTIHPMRLISWQQPISIPMLKYTLLIYPYISISIFKKAGKSQ